MDEAARVIRATRPTARDLFYAVEQVLSTAQRAGEVARARRSAVETAQTLADANAAAAEAIGRHGAALLRDGMRVLTYCNAGWLAMVDWGSALSPIYQARRLGRQVSVWVPETRPRSQGAKLTAWELSQEGIIHTVVADTAVGSLFQRQQVDLVIVGADRIAANGDVANKIGTYTIATLAQLHRVPMYVAAPLSTIDARCTTGQAIPIEERSVEEVVLVSGAASDGRPATVRIAPEQSPAFNPAFDVTPASLLTGLITETGVIPADSSAIRTAIA
jgi:methylthioribose-1-phosphate isomerase